MQSLLYFARYTSTTFKKKPSFPNILPSEIFPLGKIYIGSFWLFFSKHKYLNSAILYLAFIFLREVKKEPKLKSPRNGNTYFFLIPSAFKYHGASVQIVRYQILIPVKKMETKKNRQEKTRKNKWKDGMSRWKVDKERRKNCDNRGTSCGMTCGILHAGLRDEMVLGYNSSPPPCYHSHLITQ